MSNVSSFVKRIRDVMRNDAGINGDAQRIEQLSWILFLKVYATREEEWEATEDDYKSIIPKECKWENWANEDSTGKSITGDKLLDFVNNTLFPKLKNIVVTSETPIRHSIVKTVFEESNQYMKDGILLRQVVNIVNELQLDDYEESHAFGDIYESILKELQSAGSSGEFYTPRAITDFMAEKVEPKLGDKMADFACGTGGFITSWLKILKEQVHNTKDQELYNTSIYGIEKKQFPYSLCITNMLLHNIDFPKITHGNSLTIKNLLDYTDEDKFDVVLMNPPYGGSEKKEVKDHFSSDLASSETADLFMAVIMYRLKKNGRAAVIMPDGFLFGSDNPKINLKKKLLENYNLHTIVRLPSSCFSPYTSITTNILFFNNDGPTKETWFYRLDMPSDRKHFSKTKPMERKHFEEIDNWWNNRVEIKDKDTDTYKAKAYSPAEIEARGYDIDLCGYPTEVKEILSPEDTMRNFIEHRTALNEKLDKQLAEIQKLLGGIL